MSERDEKDRWRHPHDVPPPPIDVVRELLGSWRRDRDVHSVELMPGGLMNRNCRVSVDGSADVVLRLYDHDPSAAGKELALLRRLGTALPVPEVLDADVRGRDGCPPYLLLAFVDGISLRALKQTADAGAVGSAAEDCGRCLARLQAYRFERSGRLTATFDVDTTGLPDPLTTATLVEYFARAPLFAARAGTATADAVVRAAREWDEHPAAPPLATTLVHGDLNSRNILVQQTASGWRVSAILDWEFAVAATAYVDMGNFLRYERADRPRFEPWFSRGLRDGGMTLDGEWLRAARMADLPALCELLARASTPDDVVAEIVALVEDTLR